MPIALLLHGGGTVSLTHWHLEPAVVSGSIIAFGFYVYGLQKYGGAAAWRVACFILGLLSILIALVSPLDIAAGRLLSMHMLQHVLLTTIGPPLILLGLPQHVLRPLVNFKLLTPIFRRVTNPVFCGAIFVVNMWFWHAPPVYELALDHIQVHQVMHMAFLATGLLFWWPVIQPLPEMGRTSEGGRLLYLFVTGFPMEIVALLLISSNSVVYSYYRALPQLWGIDPLIDQQVAGMIMGALGEAAVFVAITLLFFRFLDHEGASEAPPRVGPVDAA